MEVLVLLASVAVAVVVWGVFYERLRARGSGMVVSHIGGGLGGVASGVIALVVLVLLLVPESDNPAEADSARERGTASVTSEGGGSEHSEQAAAGQQLDGDVRMSVQYETLPDGSLRLYGETNLPPETWISLSLEEDTLLGFRGQSSVQVDASGAFSEVFGSSDGLPVGAYEARASVAAASAQPDGVRSVLGAEGENMAGPLVTNSATGRTASISSSVVVGGEVGLEQQAERQDHLLSQVEALTRDLSTMIRDAREMHSVRDDDILECMDRLREVQPRVELVRAQVQALPRPASLYFGAAVGHLLSCATCLPNREEQCDQASRSLEEWREYAAERSIVTEPQ